MRLSLLACFLPLALTSCSMHGPVEPLPETGATLEGDVTIGGQKVPVALVIVQAAPPAAGNVQAFADDDGHFKIENVPVGNVMIGINTDATQGQMTGRAMAGIDQNAKGRKRMTPPKIVAVPKKYHSPEGSGITTQTQKGNNTFNVVIPK